MFSLSPWLQLPIVLVVALPIAGVAAAALLFLIDWVGTRLERRLRSRAPRR